MDDTVRHIVFLMIPDATLLDITGPYEAFSQVSEYFRVNKKKPDFVYQLHILSVSREKNVRTASGMVIQCSDAIETFDDPIDTLIIPGVPNSQIEEYQLPENVLLWIRDQSRKVRRICSVCTGSFFLAEAGILEHKKVTTHWEKCDVLSRNYPHIQVDSHPIFIRDGHVYTSAGISSGMDLALALIEEDLGRSLALKIARQMVLYLKRPGSQSQYSTVLTHQQTDHQPIREICDWIMEHLHEVITVDRLADRIPMSPRNFARVFVRETGITPAKYVDKLRIETACRYLVDTRLSLKEIAVLCGLSSPDNMRKIFIKYIRISPAGYRKNFGTAF
ncbi:MAG: GlxA family transcriptional regulator [Bacteroidales bacterium]|jgi:transcriptional regulator GlxA family with amidase domain|nr:GlxA family transcriptional regulator [Bacteroidales bacterium]